MQNAKDSFYMALRTRLAAINPERTILLRNAVRPGILVEEAEASFSQLPCDVFVLRWLGLGVDLDLGSTMVAEQCEMIYQTCGTQSFGGRDEPEFGPIAIQRDQLSRSAKVMVYSYQEQGE
jgi:hypothetical protein